MTNPPPTKWGILSAGKIANDFMVDFSTLCPDEHLAVAVGARSLDSAQTFGKLHKIQRAYGSYEAVVQDPDVDVVYIGTIHPAHFPLAKLALENGKHVLCEKPLCMNVKETQELVECARSKKLFLMEAIWSRHFPSYKKLKEEINQGTIGQPLQVIASFGFSCGNIPRLDLKELGGGTILDIGIYPIQLAQFVFGGVRPYKIVAGGHLNSDGVDTSISATLMYPGQGTATLLTHSKVNLPTEAVIVGTKGSLKLASRFWSARKLETPNETFQFPDPPPPTVDTKTNFHSQGLSLQCQEVRRCLLKGMTESRIVSHDESLIIAEIMEEIRKQLGVVYDQDG